MTEIRAAKKAHQFGQSSLPKHIVPEILPASRAAICRYSTPRNGCGYRYFTSRPISFCTLLV
jgi:hypothetical protein